MISFVCLQGGQAPTIVINGVMGPVSMAENKWVILIKTLLIGVITPDMFFIFENQLMVNCWFVGWWFGFLESPNMKGIGNLECTPRITKPPTQTNN